MRKGRVAGLTAALVCATVVLVVDSDPDRALELLDGLLRTNGAHAQALWNRGLVLQSLGLGLGAAQSFHAVAALGEPGWADEARARESELLGRWRTGHQAW